MPNFDLNHVHSTKARLFPEFSICQILTSKVHYHMSDKVINTHHAQLNISKLEQNLPHYQNGLHADAFRAQATADIEMAQIDEESIDL